jgi:signal transduction histidine kinase
MVELRKRQQVLEAENLRAKKIEAIGILAGGMAHDFNNLLQVILGYVSLARMNAEHGSKTESLLAIVEKSSESARELSARLLTFAKGGDMFKLPTQVIQIIRESVGAKTDSDPVIEQALSLPNDLPLVTVDADQMRQVFTNLINNAYDAMPQGGTLRISASTVVLPEANDFGLQQGEHLHILFEDTGIGVTPENLPKIFDPYFSTKEMGSQKGMGLSLALCHSIIKHHSGHIHAESTYGEGTSIHIYLPVVTSK